MGEQRQYEPAIYQMKAYLFYLRPAVWRRFLVRREASMEHLHQVICCLFDFDRSFPYILRAAKVRYSVGFDEETAEDMGAKAGGGQDIKEELVDETKIPIHSLVELVKGRKSHSDKNIFFYYESPGSTKIVEKGDEVYVVFSENRSVRWTVVISCEKVLPIEEKREYPVCIEGERASPPRCFSGESDYSAFVNNLKRLDKRSLIRGLKREYEYEADDYIELVGRNFDPGIVNPDEIASAFAILSRAESSRWFTPVPGRIRF